MSAAGVTGCCYAFAAVKTPSRHACMGVCYTRWCSWLYYYFVTLSSMHVFQSFTSLIYTAMIAAVAGCLGLCCLSHGGDSVLDGDMLYACSYTLLAAILLSLNIETRAVLCCAVLCCAVLCWALLCNAVLSCNAVQHAVLYTMTDARTRYSAASSASLVCPEYAALVSLLASTCFCEDGTYLPRLLWKDKTCPAHV